MEGDEPEIEHTVLDFGSGGLIWLDGDDIVDASVVQIDDNFLRREGAAEASHNEAGHFLGGECVSVELGLAFDQKFLGRVKFLFCFHEDLMGFRV